MSQRAVHQTCARPGCDWVEITTAGVSLSEVTLQARPAAKGRKAAAAAQRRAMLFTHRGFSGPAVLDLSHHAVMAAERRQPPPGALPNTPAVGNTLDRRCPHASRTGMSCGPMKRAAGVASSQKIDGAFNSRLHGAPRAGTTSPCCKRQLCCSAVLSVAWTGEDAAAWQQRLEQGGGANVGQLLRRHGIPARHADRADNSCRKLDSS